MYPLPLHLDGGRGGGRAPPSSREDRAVQWEEQGPGPEPQLGAGTSRSLSLQHGCEDRGQGAKGTQPSTWHLTGQLQTVAPIIIIIIIIGPGALH